MQTAPAYALQRIIVRRAFNLSVLYIHLCTITYSESRTFEHLIHNNRITAQSCHCFTVIHIVKNKKKCRKQIEKKEEIPKKKNRDDLQPFIDSCGHGK